MADSTGSPAPLAAGAGAGASDASARALRQCQRLVEHATSTSPRVGALLAALRERGCALAAPAVVCADVFAGAPALAAYDARAARVVMNPAVPPRHLTQHQWTRGES